MKLDMPAAVTGGILLVLAALPLVAQLAGAPYMLDIAVRIMILGMAAVSLDLVLGYGGLVSFGHAGYVGAGAFAVGILSHHGVDNGFAHLAAAIASAAVLSLLIGMVCLRTAGLHFIIITLGFGQMIYFLATSVDVYGGEDGMNIAGPSNFGRLLDLGHGPTLYYVVFLSLAGVLLFLGRAVRSRYGMVLRASRMNDRRLASIGVNVFRYRLAGFVISGTICGLAGFLLANQSLFVSPAIMHWTRSSELMIMVILGGMGTLVGPLFGAIALLLLESGLSRFTDHWQLLLGIVLLVAILFARRGIFGALVGRGAGS
ncbi:MAG: branched-chain amino acid transporter permease [Ramlibacter sp.]|jgi:branched-chain amino acid transport system permease protein|nr:branched-chain amino acid transporter permease [Ramlibacter sp.]